jgi:hypothetical protein
MNASAVLLLVVIAAIAIWFWSRGASARDPETMLRRVCRGNVEQAERLIAGELSRSPGITRAEAARRAVARYQRDNR